MNATVLAGHILAVPVVGCAARQTEVRIAFAHSEVTRTLLSVALCFTATPRKPVLACVENKRASMKKVHCKIKPVQTVTY